MNIFYLDHDPVKAAQYLCDKHIPKMGVETVQMLVSALNRNNIEHSVLKKDGTPHKGGYANHPCTRWAGHSFANFRWLLQHGIGIVIEHIDRFDRRPFTLEQLKVIATTEPFDDNPFTTPALAMPEQYKTTDPVLSYRRYYRLEKESIATYRLKKPEWWNDERIISK